LHGPGGHPQEPAVRAPQLLIRRTLLIAAVVCPAVSAAAAPSFLCSKAASWVEKTVCASERLSSLDLEVASAYATLLRSAGAAGQRELSAEQQRWWAERDRCRRQAESPGCLEQRYAQRLAELKARPGYSEERRVRNVDLPPEQLSAVGEGWSRSLSRYVRAIRACLPQASEPVRWVAAARDDGTYDDAVAVTLRGSGTQAWVCTARRDGTQVLAWHDVGDRNDDDGPRFYPFTAQPQEVCGNPVKVLDENDVHVGWLGPACPAQARRAS